MPRYLLDTNVLSDLIHHPDGRVAEKIARLPLPDRLALCTSIIVAAELRFGAAKKNAARLTRRVEEILNAIDVLPFVSDADRHYARLRAKLEKSGTIIGGNDMLIAAHALAVDCILISNNLREFQRVPGLRVQNWLER
jgi:tRNA(fMet)-specific endonuclease VapC